MNGVDAIAFTGGIGENAIPVRETVVKSLGYLGIKLDEEANQTRGENKVISTADSKVKVAIVPTNEETCNLSGNSRTGKESEIIVDKNELPMYN